MNRRIRLVKFGMGSNTKLTPKYENVKVQNDIGTSKHNIQTTKHPDFQLCYPWECLSCFARSPITIEQTTILEIYLLLSID